MQVVAHFLLVYGERLAKGGQELVGLGKVFYNKDGSGGNGGEGSGYLIEGESDGFEMDGDHAEHEHDGSESDDEFIDDGRRHVGGGSGGR